MDITCNKCGMEYSLDDTLISGSGTSVRCMNCNEVFKVYKASSKGPDEWLLRQAHGPFRTIDNLGLLQQWIQEGKISQEDLISQKNGPWKRVGDIEQLKPFFEMAERNQAPSEGRPKFEKSEHHNTLRRKPRSDTVDVTERFAQLKDTPVAQQRRAAKAIPVAGVTSIKPSMKKVENEKPTLPPPARQAEAAAGRAGLEEEITHTFNKPEQAVHAAAGIAAGAMSRGNSKSVPPIKTEAPDFSSIPVAKDDVAWGGSGEKAASAEPAWTEKAVGGLPQYEAAMDAMRPPVRSGSGKWIVAGAAAVGIVGAALFLLWPEQKDDLLSSVGNMVTTPEENRYQKFFDRGRESFLLDTDASFLQADREFQKVLALKEGHPPTLAALARLYAVWAQYLRDAKLDAAADRGRGGQPGKDASLLSGAFDEKLQEAVQWSREAAAADPHLKETLVAQADTARLSGDLKEAAAKLKEAEALGKDAQTEYVGALIDLDAGASSKDTLVRIEKALGMQPTPMIRALYRIARIQAAAGDKGAAEATLKKLFALNSDHAQAKALLARIEAKKKIVLLDAPVESAAAASSAGTVPDNAAESSISATEPRKDEMGDDDGSQGVAGMLKRATRYQSDGRTEDAKILFQKVLEREPSNLEALTGIGYSYLDKHETGKALASFRRAINVDNRHGPALIGTAETYKSMGQQKEALKFYQSYLQAAPSGRQAEMARKNISRIEAELSVSEETVPKTKASGDDGEETVIDDSPSSAAPAVEAAVPDAPAASPEKEAEPEPSPKEKPSIIIMKKDDPESAEE